MYKVSAFGLGPVDGNFVAFDNNYSNIFEKKDALKIQNGPEPETHRSGFVPQGLSFTHLSAFKVYDFLDTMMPVSLVDNTFIDFNITAEEGLYAAKCFYLVFKPAPAPPY